MKLNFKTLCAYFALLMYAGTSVAVDGDWSDELTYNPWADEPSRSTPSAKNNKESKKEKSSVQAGNSSQRVSKKNDSHSEKLKMPQEVLIEWMKAVIEGDIDTIRSYIDQNYDVNAPNDEGKTALMFAAREGQIEVVKLLLEHGADVNAQDQDEETALMEATWKGQTKIAKLLLKHGADVNAQNKEGETALMFAAWKGQTEIAKLLLEHGADVNAKDKEGDAALMFAAREGQIEVVKLLLEHGADINAENQYGETALDLARENSNKEIVKYLEQANEKDVQNTSSQSQKESTDSRYQKRKMPQKVLDKWMKAAREGDIDTIRKYINQNYDVNTEDEDGNTAFELAVKKRYSEMTGLLMAAGADVNHQKKPMDSQSKKRKMPQEVLIKWMKAADEGDIDTIRKYINQNHDINAQDENGETALMKAAEKGHKKIVELLLKHVGNSNDEIVDLLLSEKNKIKRNKEWIYQKSKSMKKQANINYESNDGKTALMKAAEKGHTEIVKLLLSAENIDVNAQDYNGKTALMYAAEKGHTEIVELLLAKVADVNARDHNRKTALMNAAEKGHTEVVKLLLSAENIDVNAKDKSENTVLMYAADEGHTEIVKLLLKHGADVNAKDGWRNTALMNAAKNGYTEIVKLLLEHGADINAQDKIFRNTALMYAADEGHTEIVKLLLNHGADVNVKNLSEKTALDYAKENNYKEIVKYLEQAKQKNN